MKIHTHLILQGNLNMFAELIKSVKVTYVELELVEQLLSLSLSQNAAVRDRAD